MQLPFISVILPVRNEERYIAACVDSIFSQDYPADQMEVIFVDGRSEDRTVELLHAMQKEHPQIVVLDNPNRTVPYAMNIGIAHSSAPVIVRLDAHAEYPADYIRLSVETLLTKDCDNAGGVFETHGRGFMGEAIAEMLKTPLGVGNATYRLTTEDGYVDTVPFGCFKRALFDRIGGFDERMTRNQDNELNFRIRKNGGKIYLNHNIRVQYYCRDTMRGIMKMGYMNDDARSRFDGRPPLCAAGVRALDDSPRAADAADEKHALRRAAGAGMGRVSAAGFLLFLHHRQREGLEIPAG